MVRKLTVWCFVPFGLNLEKGEYMTTKLLVLVFAGALAVAGQTTQGSGKPDFSGTWDLKSGETDIRSLVIQQDADKITIHDGLDATKTKVECGTRGKQCKGVVGGEPSQVTFYYNGPVLVEISQHGKDNEKATEIHRKLLEDGNTMLVEITPIAPAGQDKTTLEYSRKAETTAKAATQP